MASIVINGEKLKLPGNLADRFKGRKIELIETEDEIFIRPIKSDPIKELKGFLKGSSFYNSETLTAKTTR